MAIKTASNAAAREMLKNAAAGNANPRGNKFGAVRVVTHEIKSDSQHEHGWAMNLVMMQQAGFIENLVLEKNGLLYALDVNGYRICQYEADAKFTAAKEFRLPTLDGSVVTKPGREYVLDAKSPPTRKRVAYVLKRNLMWAIHKIKIVEV
jgi:hypothetical protein